MDFLSRMIPKDKDVLRSYSVAIFIPSETENLKQNPYRVLTNLQLTVRGFLCKLELPTTLYRQMIEIALSKILSQNPDFAINFLISTCIK